MEIPQSINQTSLIFFSQDDKKSEVFEQIEKSSQCSFIRVKSVEEFFEATEASVRCVVVMDDPLGEALMTNMYGGLMKPKNIYGLVSMNESVNDSWTEKVKIKLTNDVS